MQEIGVRVAIGADVRDILVLVLRQGMWPVGVGILIGVSISLGVARVLESMFAQVSPADPAVFVVATGLLVLVAMLGCWIPARRAARVDPVAALWAQ
jgi:putative ABC transport system permease protein